VSILAAERLSIAFGGIRAIDQVSLRIQSGVIFSIIGPNGAGKTTLFNLFSGLYRPQEGRVIFDGEDVTGLAPHMLARRGLSRTFQNLQIFYRMTAIENVMVGCHRHERTNVVADLLHLPSVASQNRRTRLAAQSALAQVGLQADMNRVASALPYGALKRLEIARALASEPKVLLLDEPAAGCNPVETKELEGVIRSIVKAGVTVVLVEHDMRLVMNVSDHIHVLANGRSLAEGTVAEVRQNPRVIEAYLGTHDAPAGHDTEEAARALG
jgi:branched-chain amino acid transport system ATP-binding protein